MSTLPVSGGDGTVAPTIHLEYIRSVAEAGEAAGVEAVEAFHRSLFLHRHGAELARQEQERLGCEARLGALELQWRKATQQLEEQERFVAAEEDGVADDQPNRPWNAWSRTMFWSAGLAIVALLVFGIFNISFNLLESGIVTFSEHPMRAYFWAALLPVGALAVKVGWDQIEGRRAQRWYAWACFVAGVAGMAAWLGAYASIYPSLSRTTEEQIRALSVFEGPEANGGASGGGAKSVDRLLVGGQAVAEIFLSALLGIYMSQLYAKHRPVVLAVNPVFAPFERERVSLESRLQDERGRLAQAVGAVTRLEHELAVFTAYARSLFLREQRALHDRGVQKQRIIERAAEELRGRLAALDEEPPVHTNGEPVATAGEGRR
ncbi:MAG: hypothetical protein IT580_11850 [Verrucomicrobiales bacterium]|nr:hypothetical protein [Verrucomicrobiales bacterium]